MSWPCIREPNKHGSDAYVVLQQTDPLTDMDLVEKRQVAWCTTHREINFSLKRKTEP